MRFVVAIVLFVVAAASIGLGIAQRTVLAGPDSLSSEVATGAAPLTVVDGETLNAHAGSQTIEVGGTGTILLAYGRTNDVLAWVGDATHNRIGYDEETAELTTRLVRGSEQEVPSPEGSDLWLREFTGTDTLTRRINAPEGISVIIAADGVEPAPSDVRITWPVDNSAPMSGPLVVGGVVVLLLGLGAFLWALIHARRRRGPRRSGPKLPKPPKPPRLKPGRRGAATEDGDQPALEAPATRPRGRRRLGMAAAGLGAVVALTACTADGGPTPTPTPTELLERIPVAVTETQLDQIVADLVQTVADADEAADAELAGTRLDGPALALRTANYAIRDADSDQAPLALIPGDIEIALPRMTEDWPRSVFAVVSDQGASPVAMVLRQQSPRENYKASYVITLEAAVPNVAPPEVGAPQLPADNDFGVMSPDQLAAAYGDILLKGDESEFAEFFDPEGDDLRVQLGAEYKADQRAKLPSSAEIAFSNGPGEDPVVAFSTIDSGQIVAVSLEDVETVTPAEAGAAINPSGAVKALLGSGQTTKGVRATYGMQLLFYVPPVTDENATIRLLGFTQGLISAVELS